MLGSSPDGIVEEEYTLEIKCPFKYRMVRNFKDVLTKKEKYIVYYDDEEKCYKINESHDYYDQIQAEIHFAGVKYGILFIWSPNSHVAMKVEKNNTWFQNNISLLLNFYHTRYIPNILSI